MIPGNHLRIDLYNPGQARRTVLQANTLEIVTKSELEEVVFHTVCTIITVLDLVDHTEVAADTGIVVLEEVGTDADSPCAIHAVESVDFAGSGILVVIIHRATLMEAISLAGIIDTGFGGQIVIIRETDLENGTRSDIQTEIL